MPSNHRLGRDDDQRGTEGGFDIVWSLTVNAQTSSTSTSAGLYCDPKFIKAATSAWMRSADGTVRGLEAGFQTSGSAGSLSITNLPNGNEFGMINFNLVQGATSVVHAHDNYSNPWPSPGDIALASNKDIPIYTLSKSGLYVTDPKAKGGYTQVRKGLEWTKPCK